jgi:hypothetical protein
MQSGGIIRHQNRLIALLIILIVFFDNPAILYRLNISIPTY